MADLTEGELEKAILEIAKYVEDTDTVVRRKPTQLIYRPADLTALGLTQEDVIKLIKEQNNV